MSYCDNICVYDINKMNDFILDCVLSQCEKSCIKYFQCDTVALMQDRLKELIGEE